MCVVGAGPAGLTVAVELARAGRRVTVVESGGRDASPAAQELNDGDVEGDPYAGLAATRARAVGGTTTTWNVRVGGAPAAKYVPLDPRDLAGWPLAFDDLVPHYEAAQRICGLGPFDYGADRWAGADRRPFDLAGTGLASGVYQFGPAARFAALAAEVEGAGGTIVPGTTVVGLDLAGRRVEALRTDGGHAIRPGAAVLACGAVENARLLLLAGIGGASGLLGRCFMEHARDFSLSLLPASRSLYRGAAFYDLFRAPDGTLVGGRLALTPEALDAHDLPNGAITLVPRPRSGPGERLVAALPDRLRRPLGLPPRGRYGWSATRFAGLVFDCVDLVLNLEHRPDPANRVELGGRSDRFGNPLPNATLRWTEAEQERLERLRGLLAGWFREAGLGELRSTRGARPDLSAHHHAGTTRLAADPQTGVVDPDARVFGVENLWLAGASVFPTAGYANPVLTVVALAHRLGRHLHAALG